MTLNTANTANTSAMNMSSNTILQSQQRAQAQNNISNYLFESNITQSSRSVLTNNRLNNQPTSITQPNSAYNSKADLQKNLNIYHFDSSFQVQKGNQPPATNGNSDAFSLRV